MSDFNQLYSLIKRGEDQQLDFKLHISDPQKIARTIVAFANSDGGQIVIGVDDQGEIKGVDVEQEKWMMIRAGKRFCDPPVYIYFKELQTKKISVLIAEIRKSNISEHRAMDQAGEWLHYVRVKDQTVLVPDIEDQAISDKYNLKPIPIVHDQYHGLVSYLEENESISIKEYMKMMNISYKIAKRSLDNLVKEGVLEKEFINNLPYYYLD